MNWIPALLQRIPHRDLGWEEIGEEFTRFTLFRTLFFNVYLHRVKALVAHEKCHDHPWSFVAILLKGGYNEYHDGAWTWRRPGSILFRPAAYSHNVVTRGVSWSIVITTPKQRQWGFHPCR